MRRQIQNKTANKNILPEINIFLLNITTIEADINKIKPIIHSSASNKLVNINNNICQLKYSLILYIYIT